MAVQLSGQPGGGGEGWSVCGLAIPDYTRLAGDCAEGSYRVLSERFIGVGAGRKSGFCVLYLRY